MCDCHELVTLVILLGTLFFVIFGLPLILIKNFSPMIQNYILEVNVLILWYVYDAKKNEFNKIEDMHYKNTKKKAV
jgi:hypothetical protein